jgi:hypothetical protein
LKLNLPLQDAGACGRCFRFRNVARVLERDGQRGMRQGVGGRKRNERKGRSNRLFKSARVTQGSNQPMMRFDVGGIGGNSCSECLGRQGRLSRSKKVKSLL